MQRIQLNDLEQRFARIQDMLPFTAEERRGSWMVDNVDGIAVCDCGQYGPDIDDDPDDPFAPCIAAAINALPELINDTKKLERIRIWAAENKNSELLSLINA